jgi:hypothetical protein
VTSSRFLLAVGLAAVMVLAGTGSYLYLDARGSKVVAPPQKPTAATPAPQSLRLPGTLYLAQAGALYSLSAGRFHQLTPEAGWTEPSLYPNGSQLLAVKRTALYSDVYVLTRFGGVVRQVTHNNAPAGNPDTGARHWSFYPRLAPDGRTMYMAYDEPKGGYDVVMSVWSLPVSATSIRQGRLWTDAIDYTGGDVQPLPLRSGALIFTRYSYGPDSKLVGQLWFTTQPMSPGRALTSASEDCQQPSLSPDGRHLAMICTYEKQVSKLVIATWNGSKLGVRQAVISNQLVAQPTWAPDGSGIAYMAPGGPAEPFQLWFLPSSAYTPPVPSPVPSASPTGSPSSSPSPSPSPSASPSSAVTVKPIQITTDLGLDATSPMAWLG